MTLRAAAKQTPLVVFFLLAYGIAWLLWLPLILSKTGLGLLPFAIPMPYVTAGTFGPAIAAWLTQWLAMGKGQFFSFTIDWRRVSIGLVTGLTLIAAGFVVLPSSILTTSDWRHWQWSSLGLYPALILHRVFLAAGPLGEEPGWRGYALPRLITQFGSIKAALLLGLLWFGWHLPLFLIPTWTSSPMLVYGLIVTSLSFTMTLGAKLSGHNILVAILLHAAFNASPEVVGDFLAQSQLRESPSFEQTLAFSFSVIALIVCLILSYLDKSTKPVGSSNPLSS